MTNSMLMKSCLVIATACLTWAVLGCVSVKAPEKISIGNNYRRPKNIDASRVPDTRDHQEARQKLAESYEVIRYLQEEVRDLEKDKEELKDEIDELERRADRDDD